MNTIDTKIEHLKFSSSFNFDLENKNTVVFGSNGMGKTSIYSALKNSKKQYEYIDYEDMRTGYITQKNNKINITPHIVEYENLKNSIQQYSQNLNAKASLKEYGITSQPKSKSYSNIVSKVVKSKYMIQDRIQLSTKNYNLLKELSKDEIIFFATNLFNLNEVDNIDKELKTLKEEYLRPILTQLVERHDFGDGICPVCESEVSDLKKKINQRLEELRKIETELLLEFMELNPNKREKEISKRFEKILEISKITSERDISEFLLLSNFEDKKNINNTLSRVEKLKDNIKEVEKKVSSSFNNLKTIEDDYTTFLRERFGVSVTFEESNYSVVVDLQRHPTEFSTGEFNLILFSTKMFEFMGGEKNLVVLDDPISSYDVINQYKIAFDIVSNSWVKGSGKTIDQRKKFFLILTHNMNLIELIQSQRPNVFEYKVFDKINKKLHILEVSGKAKHSVMSIYGILDRHSDKNEELTSYIHLVMKRENNELCKDESSKMHSIFHYNGQSSFDYNIGDGRKIELSNTKLVEYVDEMTYETFNEYLVKGYESLVLYKIVLMLGLRVWIEKKLYDGIGEEYKKKFLKKRTLMEKINYVFPYELNGCSEVMKKKGDLKVSRKELVSKKVMLNQHEHFKSQGEPFHYVMNMSCDDIYLEVCSVKNLFE